MKRFLRRIRGIIGTAITWAVGWGAVLAGLHLFGLSPILGLGDSAFFGSIIGFMAGGSFAVMLTVGEGRRRLDQLSLGRVGLWGAIGGIAVVYWAHGPIPWSAFFQFPGAFVYGTLLTFGPPCLLGAGFAAGSVAIARQADKKLIEGQRESLQSLEGE